MPDYRRLFIPRATYLFTLATHERRPWLCTAPARGALRDAVAQVRQARPFAVEAWMLLPDHLHCIWTLPPGDADYATRWRLIKRAVSVHLAGEPDGTLSDSRRRRGERGLWQRRFWEHAVRDERDFDAHCDYGHRRGLRQVIGHNAKNIDNRGFSAGSRQRLSLSGMMDHTDMRVSVWPLAV